MSNRQPILWQITISHFSEKVRWALDYKSIEHERRAPAPGLHMAAALWLTRGHAITLPILELDGARIPDSARIIEALERRFPDPALFPHDPDERRRAVELAAWFDRELGPYTRRLAFHELSADPDALLEITSQGAPELTARLGRAAAPVTRAFVGLRYKAAGDEAAEEARRKIVAAFDRLETALGEHDYLVGGRFTVADLTAASLFAPVVLPPGAPVVTERMPEPYERFREPLRDRRGYRWVEEMFSRHRHAERPITDGAGARDAAHAAPAGR
jgi:glutathione S-transferase